MSKKVRQEERRKRLESDRFSQQGKEEPRLENVGDIGKLVELISSRTEVARKNIEEFLDSLSDSPSALVSLSAIEGRLKIAQQEMAARLQEVLNGLVGYSAESFEANQAVTRRIQALLQQLQVRVKCPKTGLPGNLRYRKGGNAKYGTFQVEIVEDGKRTSRSSSTTFPALELVQHGENADDSAS